MCFYSLSKIGLGTLTKCRNIKSNESGLCNQRILSLLWRSTSKQWDEAYDGCEHRGGDPGRLPGGGRLISLVRKGEEQRLPGWGCTMSITDSGKNMPLPEKPKDFRMFWVCLRGWERRAKREGILFFLILLSSTVIIGCNRTYFYLFKDLLCSITNWNFLRKMLLSHDVPITEGFFLLTSVDTSNISFMVFVLWHAPIISCLSNGIIHIYRQFFSNANPFLTKT